MSKTIWIRSALLLVCGVLIDVGADQMWEHGLIPNAAAQQRQAAPQPPPLPTARNGTC